VALSIVRSQRVYRSKPQKNLVPRNYRHICGGGLETKSGELRTVANLCLVDLYWGRRGYTAVEGDVLSYL
jgi:hypothetical protein